MTLRTGQLNREARGQRAARLAFTLIELMLVMAILTIAISLTAPAMANFFRGRTLDSEARRLLSLARQGQSRAVAEGIPMELWVDAEKRTIGLEAEPSYEPTDAKAVSFTLDKDIQIEATQLNPANNGAADATTTPSVVNTSAHLSNHPDLPKIRFLPDGSITDTSPQLLRLTGRDGISLWIARSRNRLSYEIRTPTK